MMITNFLLVAVTAFVIGMLAGLYLGVYLGAKAENKRLVNLFKNRFPAVAFAVGTMKTEPIETNREKSPTIVVDLNELLPGNKGKNKLH